MKQTRYNMLNKICFKTGRQICFTLDRARLAISLASGLCATIKVVSIFSYNSLQEGEKMYFPKCLAIPLKQFLKATKLALILLSFLTCIKSNSLPHVLGPVFLKLLDATLVHLLTLAPLTHF